MKYEKPKCPNCKGELFIVERKAWSKTLECSKCQKLFIEHFNSDSFSNMPLKEVKKE